MVSPLAFCACKLPLRFKATVERTPTAIADTNRRALGKERPIRPLGTGSDRVRAGVGSLPRFLNADLRLRTENRTIGVGPLDVRGNLEPFSESLELNQEPQQSDSIFRDSVVRPSDGIF